MASTKPLERPERKCSTSSGEVLTQRLAARRLKGFRRERRAQVDTQAVQRALGVFGTAGLGEQGAQGLLRRQARAVPQAGSAAGDASG